MAFVTYDMFFGGLSCRQVRSTSWDPSVVTQAIHAAGASAASQICVIKAEPKVRVTTGDLAGVLAALTSLQAGLFVSSGSIVIPWNQRANGGLFAAGSSHFTLSGANGLLVPASVSATQNDPLGASMELDAYLLSTDGETAPVTANQNQALSASAFNALYEFGPCSLNGSQLTKAISSEVLFGVPANFEMYDGDHFPRFVHIDSEAIEPMIRITFANMAALASLGPFFATMTAAAVNLRRRSDGAMTVSDASASHVRFALNGGVAVVDSLSGQNKQTGQVQLTLKGKTLSVGVGVAVSL